jgi:heptosyltransferase-3
MKAPPRSVLVVVTRRIGDVLLATPVIHSLKRAWPGARVDVLVFHGTRGVIEAHADVSHVHTIPERPGLWQHLVLIASLFRRYDLALSLVPGDRPTIYAFLSGRTRVGLLLATRKESWKRRFFDHWVAHDLAARHTVQNYLAVLTPLGVPPLAEVTASWRDADQHRADDMLAPLGDQRYVVLHLYPKFNYKKWSDTGWIALARWITDHNLRIVLTGGNDADERDYVQRLAGSMSAPLNLVGQLSLNESACVLARAIAYVGPDTALTHMAAALGIPTVTLFGPTDPVKWGPWPKSHDASRVPWQRFGDQSNGNVRLLQGRAACVPCGHEGCKRNIASFSDCLLQLPPERVIHALSASINIQ